MTLSRFFSFIFHVQIFHPMIKGRELPQIMLLLYDIQVF
jgi:hypothetical protein